MTVRSLGGRVAAGTLIAKRFGWLPGAQLLVVVISVAVFAVLARLLGPDPFAAYAVLIFCFTVASLATDLSPMGFVLVRGLSAGNLALARRLGWLSTALGVGLLAILLVVVSVLGVAVSPADAAMLAIAIAMQNLAQPLRAAFVIMRRFPLLAATDVGAALVGGAAAVALAAAGAGSAALIAQLAVTVVVKLLVLYGARRETGGEHAPASSTFGDALSYGARVIPINVAAYLTRALDSGLLPFLLPAAAAATYARSYQVVVVPVTQAQLSLGATIVERLGREERVGTASAVGRRVFLGAVGISWLAGAVVILAAPLIEAVLFGAGWVEVSPTIAGMAACLPALAVMSYISWTHQVEPGLRRTLGHLSIVVVAPLSVLTAAAVSGSLPVAVTTLVVAGGLVQPALLLAVNWSRLPVSGGRATLIMAAAWVTLAGMYGLALVSA